MDNYIWQFPIFIGEGFTALIWLRCKPLGLKNKGIASLKGSGYR